MVPKKFFFTKGVGVHKDKLRSFELALKEAKIAHLNIVLVSSILPPGCKRVSRDNGVPFLNPGEITFCVMSRNETDEPNRQISASVGAAIPAETKHYGYIAEYHSFGESAETAGPYAEDLAASMLASTLGMTFDPEQAWDYRKQAFKMSKKIVYTRNVTQTAKGDKNGFWTSVVAAVVFIP
jgi:arginine decarboxylase